MFRLYVIKCVATVNEFRVILDHPSYMYMLENVRPPWAYIYMFMLENVRPPWAYIYMYMLNQSHVWGAAGHDACVDLLLENEEHRQFTGNPFSPLHCAV